MKMTSFANLGKHWRMHREIIRLSFLYLFTLINVEYFVLIQDWQKWLTFCTTQDFQLFWAQKKLFAKFFVQSAHREDEHGVGANAVKAKLKEAYHIMGLESYLRTLRSECRTCIRKRVKPFEQRIANLPSYHFEEPLQAFIKIRRSLQNKRRTS
jgi:hypothetical protein